MTKFKFSNRLSYTILGFVILIFVGVGVYAFGSVPNPGHAVSELQTCDSNGQILKMSDGSWVCSSDDSGGSGVSDVQVYSESDSFGCAGGEQIYCPGGKQVLGGGCSVGAGSYLQRSYPIESPTYGDGCYCYSEGNALCNLYVICGTP